MIFLYLAVYVFSAEKYTKICPQGQILSLYTYDCVSFINCTNSCILYNKTDARCETCNYPYPKMYESHKIFNYDELLALDRCQLSGFQDMESCQELINTWSEDYYLNEINTIDCQNCKWRDEFFSFAQSFHRSYEIEIDRNVPVQFRFNSIFTFILARFHKNGTFLGYKEVTTDLNKC